jgi:hypothetical protein
MPRHSTRHLRRTAACALIVATIGAAPATARPALEPPGTTGPQSSQPAPPTIQRIDDGFAWDSAAIGAAGATAILLLAGAGAVTLARRHRQLKSVR